MRLRTSIATATLALVMSSVLASTTLQAQFCECQFHDSNEKGHVAGAFGGGLFAGLVAVVLHMKHSREASLTPRMDPLPGAQQPFDPIVEASAGSLANEPTSADRNAAAPAATGERPGAVPAASRRPRGNRDVGRQPRLSADEAKQEGLIPPKTATMMPAYAMIGLGSVLLGLFLLRERGRRRRRY